MRTATALFLGAALALSSGAAALVRPPEGTALPDFDIRSTVKGLALGSTKG